MPFITDAYEPGLAGFETDGPYANEVLFTVPALLHTNNLFMDRGGGDMQNIFTRYEQLNNNLPINGLRFLTQALNSKNEELIAKLGMDEVKSNWAQILIRYNLAQATTSNTDQNTQQSTDYFEY